MFGGIIFVVAACGGTPDLGSKMSDPVSWMNSARQEIHNSCLQEADDANTQTDADFKAVYDACANRTAVQLLQSSDRPPGTSCSVEPTWCRG